MSVECLLGLAALVRLDWPSHQDGVVQLGPYWICRERASMLLMDNGPVGARPLPAHAHCDLLGVEASLEGQRWFVDSGNFNYDDDSMRRYCRASLAHNVATINCQNQCDVWSRFRMGFRGEPTPASSGRQGDFDWVSAMHNGYRRAGVPMMCRLVAACGEVAWLCADFVRPNRTVELTGWLHLASTIQIQQLGPKEFRLSRGDTSRRVCFVADEVHVTNGWYCPEFGKRVASPTFQYGRRLSEPGLVAWFQFPDDLPLILTLDSRGTALRIASEPETECSLFEWSFDLGEPAKFG
jgi:hypothetical protein